MIFRRWRGTAFTLPEVMIAMTITVVLFAFGYALLNMSTTVYHQVSGSNDGELQMKKLSRRMQKDLVPSNASSIRIAQVPDSAGYASDAVCMLSLKSGDRADGAVSTTDIGDPFWQRNVLYYLVRPQGDTCVGAADADGYEDACPHKVAIRKVIDSGPPTLPLPAGDPVGDMEKPIDDLSEYLTRPGADFSVASMLSETGVTDVEVVAVNVLTMRVTKDPNPDSPGEVLVTYRTFNEEASRQKIAVGSQPLSGTGKTQTQILSCFPRNNR